MDGGCLVGALLDKDLNQPLVAPVRRPVQWGHFQALRLEVVVRPLLQQQLHANESLLLDALVLLLAVVMLGLVAAPTGQEQGRVSPRVQAVNLWLPLQLLHVAQAQHLYIMPPALLNVPLKHC